MDTCFNTKITRLIMADNKVPDSTAVIPVEFLPETLYYTEAKLIFGAIEVNAKLLPGIRKGFIKLSQDIFNSFNLVNNMEICARFINGKLKFGPIMGVFMNENAVRRLINSNPTEKMARMANAAKESRVITYFFTVDDVILPENMVNAVLYKPETNSWEKRKLPLPNVLYDRGGGFTPESLAKARNLRSSLNTISAMKKLNAQHYFDKWDLHCHLSKHKEMSIYLPETISYENDISEFARMLENHTTVYLKMRTGSNGKGVIRVRKQSDSLYEYSYFKDNIVRGNVHSLEELVRVANDLMNNSEFIIQQGIDVLTYQNNKVDFRVLAQRDGIGQWQITSMPVRIAVNDCAVTSTRSGSKVYQFDNAFINILGFSRQMIDDTKSEINKLIFTAINTLEKEYGTFGELGIDVAIDKNQKLWFIESNAKPAKDTILIAGPEEDIDKSFRLPFEYCKYLAGFQGECREVDEE